MKRIFQLFWFLLFFEDDSFAQQSDKYPFHQAKWNSNVFVKINDTLYAGVYEVTNFDYKIFLLDLDLKESAKCKVQSNLWIEKFPNSRNQSIAKNYFSNGVFDLYPVVNVSFYAANKYCDWLTRKYVESKKRKKIVFELPSESEWLLLANYDSTTRLPKGLLKGKDAEGNYIENVKAIKNDSIDLAADGGFYTVKRNSYSWTEAGLYNVIGNASEMTNTEGLQKGGDWFTLLEDCSVDKRQNYETPDPRVGFRVIAKVIRKHKKITRQSHP